LFALNLTSLTLSLDALSSAFLASFCKLTWFEKLGA
jgi:hypothetical protein